MPIVLGTISTNREKSPPKFDMLGTALNNIVLTYSTFPFTLIGFGLYAELDPVFLTLEHFPSSPHPLISTSAWKYILLLPLRILVNTPSAMQTSRILALAICTCAVALHLILGVISALNRSPISLNLARARLNLTHYTHLNVIMAMFYDTFSCGLALTLSAGFVICVGFNFVTIKLYRIIPMPLFAFYPMGAVLVSVVIAVVLPIVIEVYESSKPLGEKWELQLASSVKMEEVKWIRKRIRSIRPLKVFAGLFGTNFFFLEMATKGSYYASIVDYTISALLSINI